MKININIKIDYNINPIFIEGIFNKIVYNFNLKNTTLVKGILRLDDIIKTIPYIESLNIDFYSTLSESIVECIITELDEKIGVKIDREAFCNEYADLLAGKNLSNIDLCSIRNSAQLYQIFTILNSSSTSRL